MHEDGSVDGPSLKTGLLRHGSLDGDSQVVGSSLGKLNKHLQVLVEVGVEEQLGTLDLGSALGDLHSKRTVVVGQSRNRQRSLVVGLVDLVLGLCVSTGLGDKEIIRQVLSKSLGLGSQLGLHGSLGHLAQLILSEGRVESHQCRSRQRSGGQGPERNHVVWW